MIRRLTKGLALIVFNISLTVFLLEIVLRLIPLSGSFQTYLKTVGMLQEQEDEYIYDPQTRVPAFKPHRTFRWSIMDGEWKVTTIPFPDDENLGLRDDGLNSDASRKVFACGDSYTFGFGVDDEEVWHEILEKEYNGRVDIFNLRSIGNSVSDIFENYLLYKQRFPHDTVFLCIYLGNEFMDNYTYADYRNQKEQLMGQTPIEQGSYADHTPDLQASFYKFIRKHSYTARLIKYLFFRQWIKLGYYSLDTKREVYQPEGSPFVFTIDYEENILIRTCEKEYSPTMEKGVKVFENTLERFIQMLQEDRKELFVFIFPFKEQVYWDQWAFKLSHPEYYDQFKPNQIVRESLEVLGVKYYDLTNDMIEEAKTRVLFWPIDSHWNPEGNRLAAKLIYDWLLHHHFPE